MARICTRFGRVVPRLGMRLETGGTIRSSYNIVRIANTKSAFEMRRLTTSTCLWNISNNIKDSEDKIYFANLEQELDRRVSHIDFSIRWKGRVPEDGLVTVINIIKKNQFCTSKHSLMILRCHGAFSSDEPKAARRAQLEQLIPFLKKMTKFDVSHYNAILRAHVENESKVNVSKFLSVMEAQGVEPNNITYQYIIGLLCLDGNIPEATKILEHMKMKNLRVTGSVFGYLLYGHCYNKDIESVSETMKIMESARLPPESDTYVQMMVASARVKDWRMVNVLLEEARKKDISLSDEEYFTVILALCENGLKTEAKTLFDRTPKLPPYYVKEVRKLLPQIIYAGYPEFAFEILETIQMNDTPEIGPFFARAIAKSGIDPQTAADIIIRLNNDLQFMSYIMTLVTLKNEKSIQILKNSLLERNISLKLDHSKFLYRFFSIQIRLGSLEGNYAVRIFQDFVDLDYSSIAKLAIDNTFDVNRDLPGDALRQLRVEYPLISKSFFLNQLIKHLLSAGEITHLLALNAFLLKTKVSYWRPEKWSDALIQSAIDTGTNDTLIIMFFLNNYKLMNKTGPHDSIFRGLLPLSEMKRGSQILNDVLKDINLNRIGIPRSIAAELMLNKRNRKLKKLLDQAVNDFENTEIWTKEAVDNFIEQRLEINFAKMTEVGFLHSHPNTDKKAFRLYQIYLEQGRLVEARKIFDNPDFCVTTYEIREVIDAFVAKRRLDCVQNFVMLTKKADCDRELMYLKWMQAEQNNPGKIINIWEEIQEEGYSHNVRLKARIAEYLTAAQKEVPFQTDEFSGHIKKRGERKPRSKTKSGHKIETADLHKMNKSLRMETDSFTLIMGLNTLMEGGKLSEAADIIVHHKFVKFLKGSTKKLMESMRIAGDLKLLQQFVSKMPPEVKKSLKVDTFLKYCELSDPERFVEIIKNCEMHVDYAYYKAPQKFIKELVQKDGKVLQELDTLSSSGCLPATIVLARHASSTRNAEDLMKYWKADSRNDRAKSLDMIINLDNLDSLRWIYQVLRRKREVLRVATNRCLMKCPPEEKEKVFMFALENGLSLRMLTSSSLSYARDHFHNFPYKAQIDEILLWRRSQQSPDETETDYD